MTQTRAKTSVRKVPQHVAARLREQERQCQQAATEKERRRLEVLFRRAETNYKAHVKRHLKVRSTEGATAWEREKRRLRVMEAYAELIGCADAANRGWAATRISRRNRRIQRKVAERILDHEAKVPVPPATYSEMYDVATAAEIYITAPDYDDMASAETYTDIGQIQTQLERLGLDSDQASMCSTELNCSETISQADPDDIEDLADDMVQLSELYSPSHPTSVSAETKVPDYDPAAPRYVIAPERTDSETSSSSSSSEEVLAAVEPCGGLTTLVVE